MTTTPTPATTIPPQKKSPVDRIIGRLLVDPTLGVLALLLLICLVTAFALPVFLDPSNLYNLLNTSLVVMILAMGMTVVLISGGIDLSIGTTMALCAGVAASTMNYGLPLIAALLAALATGVLVGVGNGPAGHSPWPARLHCHASPCWASPAAFCISGPRAFQSSATWFPSST
jgi:predicted ABC-type sugar transport system permease subunit